MERKVVPAGPRPTGTSPVPADSLESPKPSFREFRQPSILYGDVTLPTKASIRFAKWGFLAVAVLLTARDCPGLFSGDAAAADRRLTEAADTGSETGVAADPWQGSAQRRLSGDKVAENTPDEVVIPNPLNSMLAIAYFCFTLCFLLESIHYVLPEALKLPISLIIFIVGGIVHRIMRVLLEGHLGEDGLSDWLNGRKSLSNFDAHALFFLILPPLLYESSAAMSWHVLRKVLASSVTLALSGVIVNTAILGPLVKVTLQDTHGEAFSWEASFLLAAILSATDPAAVSSALRLRGAPQKLPSLIDGESLLNNGSAVVVYLVFKDWASKTAPDSEKMCPGASPSAGCIIVKFIQLAIGGTALGVAFGQIVYLWLRRVRFFNSPPLEIAILLTGVYATFFVCEVLHTSGVLGTVVFGIMMTAKINPILSHEARHAHHAVLRTIAYMSDKIIFFIGGMVAGRLLSEPLDHIAPDSKAQAYGNMVGRLFALYFILHLARFITVSAHQPFLAHFGYGFSWQDGVIMVYGVLRGALGLTMGSMVESNEYIDRATRVSIAFNVSGIVFLTLVINGSTVSWLYEKLNPYPPNVHRIQHLTKQLRKLERQCQVRALFDLQKHWFFQEVDFAGVFQCVPNFACISFDEYTTAPIPMGICRVNHALKALEVVASSKTCDADMQQNFESEWRRKRHSLSKNIATWLDEAMAQELPKTGHDVAVNVLEDGEGALIFKRLGTQVDEGEYDGRIGYYLGAAPLSALADRFEDHSTRRKIAHFAAKLDRVGKELIVIGLSAKMPDTVHDGIVGVVEHTAGLIIDTGEIVYNTGEGERMLSDTWEALKECKVYAECEVGADVTGTRVPGTRVRGWQLGEWFVLADRRGFICMYEEEAAMQTLLSQRRNSSKIIARMRSKEPSPAIEPSENTLKPLSTRKAVLEVVGGLSNRHFFKPHDEVVVSVQRFSGQPWSITFEVVPASTNESKVLGILSLGQFPPQDLHPVVEFHQPPPAVKTPNKSHTFSLNKPHSFNLKDSRPKSPVLRKTAVGVPHPSKVSLSFEPNVSQYQYSITDIQRTLFNMVTWHYHKMHEDGVIGDHALAWLEEAASEAKDCVDGEKNAARVSNLSGDADMMTKELQRSLRVSANGKPDPEQKPNPFEPLIVEYLCIQANLRKASLFDNYKVQWPLSGYIRSFGYSRTRAKVEALYAFVECHEKVLHDFAHLTRYPGLRHCIQKVLKATRLDMDALMELNARRVFFCKHTLALQIALSHRLHKLEEQVKEGWLSSRDVANLIERTRGTLAKVQATLPMIGRRTAKDTHVLLRSNSTISEILKEFQDPDDDIVDTFADPSAIAQDIDAMGSEATGQDMWTSLERVPKDVREAESLVEFLPFGMPEELDLESNEMQ